MATKATKADLEKQNREVMEKLKEMQQAMDAILHEKAKTQEQEQNGAKHNEQVSEQVVQDDANQDEQVSDAEVGTPRPPSKPSSSPGVHPQDPDAQKQTFGEENQQIRS